MNPRTKPDLPPNPYKRSPIRKREDLAGRSAELKTIRYYLNLTVAGQSPHLALIGQRGVGKTSLLNGADSIALELKLLPVRLDMNELKANSPGRFWHDLYQTLALSMVNAGCWGGKVGPLYEELLRMLHARQPGSIERAVMQIPYVFSCHQGSIENFECHDSLVISDFQSCLIELERQGLKGIALLIDEADCLGRNVPLLQMFRNIFQVVESCSLVLAGTEAVFPALSEVFSPIPRQFHRVDVRPFSRWTDTLKLVLGPISPRTIAPEVEVVQELHQLCGGAPDEIQLYCHHMYRSVEEDLSNRMTLSPWVFREVLREYRTNSPANLDTILNAIEKLPDELLFKSRWLARRELTLDENITSTILSQELRNDSTLSKEERDQTATKLRDGYCSLYEAGITEAQDQIKLVGSPLTAGFWKSYVEVERDERWAWDDSSYSEHLRQLVSFAIGKSLDSLTQIQLPLEDKSLDVLKALRNGEPLAKEDEGVSELAFLIAVTFRSESKHGVDVTLHMESPAGRQTFRARYVEQREQEIDRGRIQEWISAHESMLAANQIFLDLVAFIRWDAPTREELDKLEEITGSPIPQFFAPIADMEQAVAKFAKGDIKGCAEDFEAMLAKRESFSTRNNLGFCQILLGQITEAIGNLTMALTGEYEPLYELNKGVAEFLNGCCDASKKSLRNALREIERQRDRFDPRAVRYVLMLESSERRVWYCDDLPIDAAIWINLWQMDDAKREEMETALAELYQSEASSWLAKYATR